MNSAKLQTKVEKVLPLTKRQLYCANGGRYLAGESPTKAIISLNFLIKKSMSHWGAKSNGRGRIKDSLIKKFWIFKG